MNPIEDGPNIFKKVAEKFSVDELKSETDIRKFFDILLDETDGLVVVNFLDTSSWDSICSYEFDGKSRHLYLYWHDYRGLDANEPKGMRLAFPASLYGLFMYLQSIMIVRTSYYPLFLLRGYALTNKQIKRILVSDLEEYEFDRDRFFSRKLYRKIDDQWQVLTCHNTPIYSALIVPKKSNMGSMDVKFFLYGFNVASIMERLQNVHDALHEIDENEIDEICGKANTVRRLLENALKIECCYREVELKKPYSKLRLGELWGELKDFHPEPVKIIFGKLAEWSNELSHDSGMPVEKEKAEALSALTMAYIESLRLEIQNKHSSFYMKRYQRAT